MKKAILLLIALTACSVGFAAASTNCPPAPGHSHASKGKAPRAPKGKKAPRAPRKAKAPKPTDATSQ